MSYLIEKKILDLEKTRSNWNISKINLEIILKYCKDKMVSSILEIGSYNGYSALNFAHLDDVNLVESIEIDEKHAKIAKENCEISPKINILLGDAIKILKKLNLNNEKNNNSTEPGLKKFDLIFIDGKKKEYGKYLEESLKLLANKGGIFIDNTISHKEKLDDFFNVLTRKILQEKYSFKEFGTKEGLILIEKIKFIDKTNLK